MLVQYGSYRLCYGNSAKGVIKQHERGKRVHICVYVDYLQTLKINHIVEGSNAQYINTFRDKFIAQLHSQTKTRQLRGRN